MPFPTKFTPHEVHPTQTCPTGGENCWDFTAAISKGVSDHVVKGSITMSSLDGSIRNACEQKRRDVASFEIRLSSRGSVAGDMIACEAAKPRRNSGVSRGKRPGTILFSVKLPNVKMVAVAGDFNGWKPEPMCRQRDGSFRAEVDVPPGEHEYKLIIDNRWIIDPDVNETSPNDFGALNSVLLAVRAKEFRPAA